MKVFYDMEVNLLIKTFEVLCLFISIHISINLFLMESCLIFRHG